MKNREIAVRIVGLVHGKENITGVTSCVTRCRVEVADTNLADVEALKQLEGVQGVIISGNQVQVVLGPGKCLKVAQEIASVVGITYDMMTAKELKSELNAKNATPFKLLLKKCAGIFIPILPAIIAGGLLQGFNNIIANTIPAYSGSVYYNLIKNIAMAVYTYFPIFVGISAAKTFGGSMFVGGSVAAILQMSGLSAINLFGIQMVAGRGGIIAVLGVTAFAAFVEKKVRKVVPDVLDIFLTPLITVLISGLVGLLIIQPVGGIISDAVVAAINFGMEKGGFLFGFCVSAMWLPLVATGLHHGVTPIKAELMETIGNVPIQVMCAFVGAGQVGAVLAVYLKTKNKRLKQVVLSGIPIQLLGIGEPLIYGVTLPLVKPFICSCICAGVGGGIAAVLGLTSFGYGLSGLLVTLTLNNPLIYLGIYAVVVVLSFIMTYFVGFEDTIED